MNELRGLWRGKINDELNKEHNGEWIEGDLLWDKYSDGSMSCGIAKRDGFVTVRLVDPDTLGECTSLTDKNGVKIFEGDIIKGKEKTAYTVEYCSGIASFCARAASPSPQKMLPCMTNGTMKYYKVIGNIHDNPELLKAERNDENVDNGR